jgi:hypothetical protein
MINQSINKLIQIKYYLILNHTILKPSIHFTLLIQ